MKLEEKEILAMAWKAMALETNELPYDKEFLMAFATIACEYGAQYGAKQAHLAIEYHSEESLVCEANRLLMIRGVGKTLLNRILEVTLDTKKTAAIALLSAEARITTDRKILADSELRPDNTYPLAVQNQLCTYDIVLRKIRRALGAIGC